MTQFSDPRTWPVLWIGGYDGIVLGYGPTADLARQDACDFCETSAQEADVEVALASPAFRARVVSLHEGRDEYTIKDGVAYTR
jgi:hypothetical protein